MLAAKKGTNALPIATKKWTKKRACNCLIPKKLKGALGRLFLFKKSTDIYLNARQIHANITYPIASHWSFSGFYEKRNYFQLLITAFYYLINDCSGINTLSSIVASQYFRRQRRLQQQAAVASRQPMANCLL
jgi:hypothetical protein